MSSPAFEAFLARLYIDEDLRLRFLTSPADVARESGLSDTERQAVEAIDRDGLILAAESYARKRGRKSDLSRSRRQLWSSALGRTPGLLLRLLDKILDRTRG